MEKATLLQKKTRCVKMGKEEILLILRAYQSHPTSWSEVLEEIKDNLQLLPTNAADLYRSATLKKLRDRMSVKFGKLISAELISIKDLEIRNEVSKIKSNERRLVQRSVNTAPAPPAPAPAPLAPAPAPPAPAPPAPAQPAPAPPAPAPPVDRRDALVRGLSDSDDQQRPVDADEVVEQPLPGPARAEDGATAGEAPRRQRPRKRSLATLIRENQEAYHKSITKKVPKLLRQLGVSSSDDSD